MATFTQNFTAGFDSVSMQQHAYGSMTTAPGGSSLYPFVINADECDIDSQHRLIHWAAGPSDWQIVIWAESGVFGTPSVVAEQGRAEWRFDAQSQPFSDCVEMDLIVLQPIEALGNHPNRTALGVYLAQDSGSTWKVILGYYLSALVVASEQQIDTFTFDTGDVIGSSLNIAICWDVVAQSLRVFFNNTEIYTVTAAFTLKTTAGVDHLVAGYRAGTGIPGPMRSFSMNNVGCFITPEIPANNSAECCASPGVEGSGVTAPGAGVERAVLLSGAWAGRCEGGGTVPLLADLVDAESWADS